MTVELKDRADLSRLLWQAALAAEQGYPTAAAELLEIAAQRLRGKEVKEPKPAPARE